MDPIKRPVRRFPIAAYDLEWDPETLRLRLIGVFDERGYRGYTNVADFLTHELTPWNRGRVFFAHAGGRFDVQFVLRELIKHGFSAEGTMSGASIVRLHTTKGRQWWIFADSYFLLKAGLGKVGASIGLEKGECPWDAPMGQLRDYNERDCEIVFRGILRLRDILEEQGGELKYTLASCAMALFRRRFLKRTIPTSRVLNDTLRSAYFASRVELYRTRARDGYVYDINSSFPWSMTGPLPGRLISDSRRRGSGRIKGALHISRCKVTVPEMELPPLPYRVEKGGIYFPSGTWEGYYSDEDLAALDESGGSYEIQAEYAFEPFGDCEDYVAFAFGLKEEGRKGGDDFLYEVGKLLGNGLYGKFAEGVEKASLLLNPPEILPTDEPGEWPGMVVRRAERDVETAHLPIAIYITSRSRALLWRLSSQCAERAYSDTDSIHTSSELPTSAALGALKVQDRFTEAHYAAPKLYAYRTPQADKPCSYCDKDSHGPCAGHDVVKSKGFRKLDRSQYDMLVNGAKMTIDIGFRGVLSTWGLDADSEPVKMTRSLHRWLVCTVCWERSFTGCLEHGEGKSVVESDTRPKRAELGPAGSRAWTVRELEETWITSKP